MRSKRLESFQKIISQKSDAAIIKDPSNKKYLTSIPCDEAGILVVSQKKSYFIIDSRYIEIAKRFENRSLTILLKSNLTLQLKELFEAEKIRNACVEESIISVSEFEKLKKMLPSVNFVSGFDAAKAVMSLRKIKSREEINSIIDAQKVTDDAFSYMLTRIEEGRTEKELSLELEFFMRSNGADKASFDVILISGKNTSLPHGTPSNRKIKKGDFVLMDFGADINGYKSDMTRTVAVGKASDEQKNVYKTVLNAQLSAFEKIRAGESCREVDAVSRNFISDAGYGKFFGHALGHSVGLDIHESPVFSPKSFDILAPSMILTVEPGIYIPEKFGVRIEDMVLVTEKGYENLTKSDKSLIIL